MGEKKRTLPIDGSGFVIFHEPTLQVLRGLKDNPPLVPILNHETHTVSSLFPHHLKAAMEMKFDPPQNMALGPNDPTF